jgi:glutamyl-tRNA reductase
MIFANRTVERAQLLAGEFNAEAISLAEMPARLADADIVISSTASQLPILGKGAVESALKARRHRPMFMLDIAVPRDIEPACREIAGVSLHDIDDVQQIAERNASGREAEARRAELLLDAEQDRFERWLASLSVTPTIAAMRERADEIVRRVLAENEGRWEELSEADQDRLNAMARAIASRLLHEPTLRMKRSAGSDEAYLYVSALRELFGLDAETEPEGEGASNVTELRRKGHESA